MNRIYSTKLSFTDFYMETIRLYIEILTDPSIPAHRIARKTGVLTLIAIGFLIYYRHFLLQLWSGEAILVTFGLSFFTLGTIGIFGGILAGSFYTAFLKDVGAQKEDLTITVFFVEWLFAATAPFLGILLFSLISFQTSNL